MHRLSHLRKPAAQNELRRARKIGALLLKHRAAPLGLGGKGDSLDTDPVAVLGEQLTHGPVGVVFRLPAAVHGRQNPFQPFRWIGSQGNQICHFHLRLGDGTGLIHAQHIHPRQ